MLRLTLSILLVLALAVISLFIGVIDITASEENFTMLTMTRIPRTVAVILTGMSLAVAGVIMQILARNKFVEPTTTGTVEWATLGILLVLIYAPHASMPIKLVIASVFSVIGSASFLFLLSRIKLRSKVIVPLVGIIYGGIISSIVMFIAFQHDLVQSIWTWVQGDFSMILKGRYELLWISAVLCVLAYLTANQFTLVGLGKSMSTNLGLNYNWYLAWGILIVSLISGITVVTAGVIPFLGLVVPNLVSAVLGDNLKKTLPWIALIGALLVLLCDIAARVIRFPYEIPIGIIMGIIGSIIFLSFIIKANRNYD